MSPELPQPPAPMWKRAHERSTPLMLTIIVWIALRLGRCPARLLLVPISIYFQLTSARARRAARQFLGRALGRKANILDVFKNIHAFASCILDRVFLLSGRHRHIKVTRHGDAAATAIPAGGALLLASHLGSFGALHAIGGDKYDRSFRIVMDSRQAPMLSGIFAQLNPQFENAIIDSDSGPALGLKLREALQQDCLVGLMADRLTPNDKGIVVDFMGAPAKFPVSPWEWSAVLGAPVMLCFGLYRGANHYDLHIEPFAGAHAPIPRRERAAYIKNCVQRYALRLEHHARTAPYNWFNFYDFWATASPAPPRD